MDDIQTILFWLIAVMTALCAIATVVTQNIVRSATWLLFTLAGTSGIFFQLGADLVGTVQLLVYVGGTLVLVVFGVMLTAQGPFINMKTSSAEWGISAVVGTLLLAVLIIGALRIGIPGPPPNSVAAKYKPAAPLAAQAEARAALKHELDLHKITEGEYALKIAAIDKEQVAHAPYSAVLGEGFLGIGVGPAHKKGVHGDRVVRTHYLLPFEIVSVHLLVVLIGAAYLARAKRRRGVVS